MSLHPLDSLTEDEFRATAAILRREQAGGDAWRFASVELREPAKSDVKAWTTGDPIPRHSFAVLWDRTTNQTYEAVVDLSGDRVESWTHVPDVCPNFTVDEYHEVDHALHEHPDVLAKLAERGISDPSLVLFDVWTYGHAVMPEQWRDRRLGWCDLWLRATPAGNPYAHPVSGLKVIVDMNTLEVLDIEDHHDYGLPEVDAEYDPAINGIAERTDLKPLEISQPEGVSFTLDGSELRWQNWSMRLGFNYREGPVISQVAFDDREVAYRMSFAEMVVPYRDPGFDHYRRTAFDIGEWGLGFMTTSLELGCDCLGEIVYVDAVVPDSRGEPQVIKQAICLHEEDNAVLWKHVDGETGAQVRRMRRMVVSIHATVANYEYLIYWRFYQDGNIECEVRATGLMVTTPLPGPDDTARPARSWTPGRTRRSTSTSSSPSSTWTSTGPTTPWSRSTRWRPRSTRRTRTGWRCTPSRRRSPPRPTPPATTSGRRSGPGRCSTRASATGTGRTRPTRSSPGAAIPPLLDPSSPVYQRAPVIGHTLWVTAYDDAERWPAGDYPTQSTGGTGITQWIADDAPLVDTDVVLWYVFGIHHITRVEDWPIMPVDTISFWLKPFGFFDQNPAMDAPASGASTGGHCHPQAEGKS